MSKIKVGTISGQEVLLSAKNKMNKSMEVVRQGTGAHKSKKQYTRKKKHKKEEGS